MTVVVQFISCAYLCACICDIVRIFSYFQLICIIVCLYLITMLDANVAMSLISYSKSSLLTRIDDCDDDGNYHAFAR